MIALDTAMSQPELPLHTVSEQSNQTITVLLIDDQVIVSEVIRRSLETQPDITFHYCADPNQAIQMALAIQPTVILQDLVMPDIDGLMLLRWFRQHPETAHIPMIVLSNKEDASMKAEAFTNGANDYLTKLPDPIELLARIRYHSQAFNNFKALMVSTAAAQAQAQQLTTTLSQLQEAQAQLIQTEKMSGLGQMVAGIAHEINNPVNFIHGNLKYVQQHATDLAAIIQMCQQQQAALPEAIQTALVDVDVQFVQDDFNRAIASMAKGADRISSIVKSLRNFARLDEADQKEVDLHEGIDSTLMLLDYRLINQFKVSRQFGDLPPVQCYPAQLNQVFMHLINNAIDAIQTQRERNAQLVPQITITTAQISAEQVELRIHDNGIGIPDDLQDQIFNPFFTTKSVDTGKGLGLAICYRVMQNHNGEIVIDSVPGQSTTAIVRLPIHQSDFT
jgi:two-component system, NtrC family, sensor kinase